MGNKVEKAERIRAYLSTHRERLIEEGNHDEARQVMLLICDAAHLAFVLSMDGVGSAVKTEEETRI